MAIGPSENDLVKSVANKMSKQPGKNNPQYWVDVKDPSQPARIGPFKNQGKAQAAQRNQNKSGAGYPTELIFQPRNTPGKVGVTTPSYRVSPRTGQMSNRKTISGVPSYHEGDDTKRGA